MELEDFHILAWSPDPEPGRKPPTQVHIVFHIKDLPDVRFVMRLKTVDGMDAFLRLLAEYRRHVWGSGNTPYCTALSGGECRREYDDANGNPLLCILFIQIIWGQAWSLAFYFR